MQSLTELAAEILSDKAIVSWEGVRHVCRLLLAYADYSCAAADTKGRAISDDPRRVVDSVMGVLAELESVHEDCARAWRNFQSADWSRGAFETWRANDETFCAALESSTRKLEALRLEHFASNRDA